MDAITLLKNDHKTVEALFKRFEKLGDGGGKEKKQIVSHIIRELSIHATIEEQVFYPAARKAVKASEGKVLESLEEHHIVKWTLSELEGMNVKDERYDAKVTVLMESVRHHIKEEEGELFPQVSKKLGREALLALGRALESAKKMAPTRPHPRAPDTPPGNVVAALPAAMLDKAKDFVQGMAKRAQAKANGQKKAIAREMRQLRGDGKRRTTPATTTSRGRSRPPAVAAHRAH
jgi:hemerythrin superfamily protein